MIFKKDNHGYKGYEDDSWKETGKSPWLRSAGEFILEVIKVVVISLAIIIPVRVFVIQPFYVKGASMEPNFYDHEYLIIDEISYRLAEPKRGDIIVFRFPKDVTQYFIKRIVGLPGEQVEIRNGQVYVYNSEYPDGKVINENLYLPADTKTYDNRLVQLGSSDYFVLGDNRSYSMDSRSFGPVAFKYIVGRAWFRGWPLNKVSVFSTPDYQL